MIHDRHDGTFESIHWNLKSTSRCKQRDTYSKKHAWDLIGGPEKISVPPNLSPNKKWKKSVQVIASVHRSFSIPPKLQWWTAPPPLWWCAAHAQRSRLSKNSPTSMKVEPLRKNEEWPCWAFAFAQSDGIVILWKSFPMHAGTGSCFV